MGLTNYELGFEIPYSVSFLPNVIGEPINSLKNSFDCLAIHNKNIKAIYLRCIWSLIIPLVYVFSLMVIYVALILMKKATHKIFYVYNGLTFILMLMQPSVVSMLISILSCRVIGGKKYIMADITQTCYTEEHNIYIVSIVLPSLFIWGIMIPTILFRILKKNKYNLQTI